MFALSCNSEVSAELPNILWLTSEDNSLFFGCYGDSFATTPYSGKLASEGFSYTYAYANVPVCTPVVEEVAQMIKIKNRVRQAITICGQQ
ncbi:MAG TPA: hypothetical protein DD458_06980 [Prolixibacteraceae bacterium]|nr:hypothetical protein [Marinilabiliales bacterium]HBL74957.1 hypothetical protein [Prolixibacteraceae bacterium]HCU62294.1 hypothetical protein [Prolixibacteraceae bacterium]